MTLNIGAKGGNCLLLKWEGMNWECQQSGDREAATEDEVETVHVPPSGEL